ncbi:MAG: acetyltransferase [Marmoricola sp.]
MLQKIVVVGAGGFGREVIELIHDVNGMSHADRWELVGVLDDGATDSELLGRLGTRHLGPVDSIRDLSDDVAHVIAIGGCSARASIDTRLQAWGRQPATLVHPTAVMGRRSVEIGEGSILCAHSSLTTNVRLGRHVHVNPHASVGHDTTIGAHTTLTPHAAVAGEVCIGNRVFVGTGAVVGPRVVVEDDVLVGAGAVVMRRATAGATVVGVPARPM